MKIGLVYPPLADPSQPYSSLPALSAYLQIKKHHKVSIIDDNVAFYRYALSPSFIQDSLRKIENRISLIERKDVLEEEDRVWYAKAALSQLKASFILDGIEEALQAISSKYTFYKLASLNNSQRIIKEAIDLLSTAWAPYALSSTQADSLSFSTIKEIELLLSNSADPFQEYFKNNTLSYLSDIEAIGISLTYRKQIVPSFILARLIKERMREIPVIIGGNIPSIWYDNLEELPELFEYFDYVIAFEGETALETLLTALESKTSLEKVPNLIYKQGTHIKKNTLVSEDLSTLPTPDYQSLSIKQYFAPEPVLLIYTTRGCYWSRCKFCSVSPAVKGCFRKRPLPMVCNDILTLNESIGARYFAFADDCIPPGILASLSDLIIAKGLKILWQCEVRFEESLSRSLLEKIHKAGCRNLIFGFESFSDELLHKMDKGTQSENIRKVIVFCRKLGIAMNLQFFFGFPGETEKDAMVTSQFIMDQTYGSITFSFGIFELHPGSSVHVNPESFGIRIHRHNGPLSTRLSFSQVPDHAEKARKKLHYYLKSKINYPYAGLSLNAYTLLFLGESGVAALGDLYNSHTTDHSSKSYHQSKITSLVPGKKQQVGLFYFNLNTVLNRRKDAAVISKQTEPIIILYDHDLDKTVEISQLALTVIQKLNDGRSLTEVRKEFIIKLNDEQLTSTMHEVLDDLVLKLRNEGFLVSESHLHG